MNRLPILSRAKASAAVAAIAALILLYLSSGRAGAQQAARLLPASDELKGWVQTGPPKTYAGQQLFDYMDGAGEIPRSYGFQELASGKYRNGGVTLEAAVFDMGSPANAFGYYSARSYLERSPGAKDRIVALDHPAHLYASVGVLTLWKDRYTIILQPETGKPTEDNLIAFAKAIARRIKAKGALPAELAQLPTAGRIANSERFVKGKAAFDALLLFTPRDPFEAGHGAEAIAADYGSASTPATLALVRVGAGRARAALEGYRAYLTTRKAVFASPAKPDLLLATARKEMGTGAQVIGDRVALVVGAKDAKTAQVLLQQLAATARKR